MGTESGSLARRSPLSPDASTASSPARQLLDAGISPRQIKGLAPPRPPTPAPPRRLRGRPSPVSQEGRWLAAVLAVGRAPSSATGPPASCSGSFRAASASPSTSPSPSPRPAEAGRHRHPPPSFASPAATRRSAPDPATTADPHRLGSGDRLHGDCRPAAPSSRPRSCTSCSDLAWPSCSRRPRAAREPERSGSSSPTGRCPSAETRSWLEELLLRICRDHGLPVPAVSVPLLGYEVDFLWPAASFVVEADGGDHLNRRHNGTGQPSRHRLGPSWPPGPAILERRDGRRGRGRRGDARDPRRAAQLRSDPPPSAPSADRDHALDRDPGLRGDLRRDPDLAASCRGGESRSFGRVIIFMYLQKAIRLAAIRSACGAACSSG